MFSQSLMQLLFHLFLFVQASIMTSTSTDEPTYKINPSHPWPVVIVDSIPLQRNNSDCGVFTIKYFEYIAAGFDLDTLCQENMSYFRKQLAFQLWTNTPMY